MGAGTHCKAAGRVHGADCALSLSHQCVGGCSHHVLAPCDPYRMLLFALQAGRAMQELPSIFAAQRQLFKSPCAHVELWLHWHGPAPLKPCTMPLPMWYLNLESVRNDSTSLSQALTYASALLGACSRFSCCPLQKR